MLSRFNFLAKTANFEKAKAGYVLNNFNISMSGRIYGEQRMGKLVFNFFIVSAKVTE